jgi:hypothetical protein
MELAAPLMIASTVLSAAGTISAGNAARGAANFEAAQMTQKAGQERATAQRSAIEQRRRANLTNSRAQAVAAASGGGAADPTVTNLMTDITGRGEYNALSEIFSGEEKARGFEMGASARRYEGAQARQASLISAGGTILSSASTLYSKYGDNGPPTKAFGQNEYGPHELPWLSQG